MANKNIRNLIQQRSTWKHHLAVSIACVIEDELIRSADDPADIEGIFAMLEAYAETMNVTRKQAIAELSLGVIAAGATMSEAAAAPFEAMMGMVFSKDVLTTNEVFQWLRIITPGL